MTLSGTNLAPELKITFAGGTGPLPSARSTRFDPAGGYVMMTVCVPKAKGGRKPQLGSQIYGAAVIAPGTTKQKPRRRSALRSRGLLIVRSDNDQTTRAWAVGGRSSDRKA